MKKHFFLMALFFAFPGLKVNAQSQGGVKKIQDFVIYSDTAFYSTFPSVVKTKTGEYLLAFRRAPDRKVFGAKGSTHVDPNSYLMGLRSADGIKWSKNPELIYAHAFGGSQDPCLFQHSSGMLICASYGWAFIRDGEAKSEPLFRIGSSVAFLGGYVLRSGDGGKSWDGPFYPPHIKPEVNRSPIVGLSVPAYNRGAMYEGADGKVYWSVAATGLTSDGKKLTSDHLLVSDDVGKTWRYSAPVAGDDTVAFNEASVYITPKGDIISFLRTGGYNDYACIARSSDGGKTFSKWQSMGFKGFPLQATRLSDNRVFLVYGYRFKPFGIRARILNAECTDFETAPEIVLRDDGDNADIGYPWAVRLKGEKLLVVYYFNKGQGVRQIEGTVLEVLPSKSK